MGVALVPGPRRWRSTREDVAVRPLRGRPPYRRIGAVFQPEPPAAPIATMVDCLRDAAARLRRVAGSPRRPGFRQGSRRPPT